MGKSILLTIQLSLKAGDPIERIISQMEKLRNQGEKQQKDVQANLLKLSAECDKSQNELNKNIADLDYSNKDISSTLMQKKAQLLNSGKRVATNQDTLQQLRSELKIEEQLAITSAKLYQYNLDQLEQASHAINEVKALFVKYLLNEQHRRKILGYADSFLQGQGIDIEQALNEDFRDDVEDESDLNERRIHYQVFVFVEITVGIKKLRESLKGLSGIEALLQGFEEIASVLHSAHTKDDYCQGITFIQKGRNPEQTVELLSKLIIDICARCSSWIQEFRRWEDKSQDAKKKMSSKLQQMLKQQLLDIQVQFDKLSGENRLLSLAVEKLTSQKENSIQRLESRRQQMNDKTTECQQEDYELNQDLDNINEEQLVLNQVLEILEQKGGQIRDIIAQKIYG